MKTIERRPKSCLLGLDRNRCSGRCRRGAVARDVLVRKRRRSGSELVLDLGVGDRKGVAVCDVVAVSDLVLQWA